MKQKSFFLMLAFFTLILSGCSEKTTSKRSSSSSSSLCTGSDYYCSSSCAGYSATNYAYYCAGGTTGSTTGGSTNCNATPIPDTCTAQYCAQTPRPAACLANGTNCNVTPTAYGCPGSSTYVAPNPYYGVQYPPSNVPPTGTCSKPTAPAINPSAFDTYKATLTMVGKRPENGAITYNAWEAGNLLNTSPALMSLVEAHKFFYSDAVLKVRLTPKPQPVSSQTMCTGRVKGTRVNGYTKLSYYVKVYAVNVHPISGEAQSVSYVASLGPYETGVNSCSQTINLSTYKEQYPDGIVISIDQVQANQDCTGQMWTANGYGGCTSFKNVRDQDCWQMDVEVATDDTKTF